MAKTSVLICDDNPAIQKSLSGYFEEEGIDVICASTGEEALAYAQSEPLSLMILDVMLPGLSGLDVCREIRKTSTLPILMLSAKSDEFDRILGLEIGADDYVTKPFSPREVIVRSRKLLQRSYSGSEQKTMSVGELILFPDAYEAYIGKERLRLAAKEFEVLRYLIAHAGKAVTREHIINAVWGCEYTGEPRIVDTLIKRLRQKLFTGRTQKLHFDIATIFGVGYKLEELP